MMMKTTIVVSHTAITAHICNHSTKYAKAGRSKFEANMSYTLSPKPMHAAQQEPASKNRCSSSSVSASRRYLSTLHTNPFHP